MQNEAHIVTLVKKLIITILNLKLLILLAHQNIKIFVQKFTLQIGLNKFLGLKKLKILCRGHSNDEETETDSNETNVTCKTQNLYIFLNV